MEVSVSIVNFLECVRVKCAFGKALKSWGEAKLGEAKERQKKTGLAGSIRLQMTNAPEREWRCDRFHFF